MLADNSGCHFRAADRGDRLAECKGEDIERRVASGQTWGVTAKGQRQSSKLAPFADIASVNSGRGAKLIEGQVTLGQVSHVNEEHRVPRPTSSANLCDAEAARA